MNVLSSSATIKPLFSLEDDCILRNFILAENGMSKRKKNAYKILNQHSQAKKNIFFVAKKSCVETKKSIINSSMKK